MANETYSGNPGSTTTADPGSTRERVSDMANQAKDRVSDMANQAKEKANEFGRTAVQKMDESRTSAADALHSTADSLRTGAQTGSEKISGLATAAADKLESTSSYLREHDVRGMMGDLEGVVRRNPGPSLIAAAAFGFLLGSALRGGSRD